MEYINNKRRKRSNQIIDKYSNIDNDNKNNYEDLINNLKNISINQNTNDLLLKLTKRMNDIEKKIDNFVKIEIKIEKLNKKLDEITLEKDYIIDNLKNENMDLKNYIYDLENKNIKIYSNDYFS
jgi:hypothetical protein